MKISFVVIAYNQEKNLTKCVSSIRNHCQIYHEIIIVDDGSSDATFEIAQGLNVERIIRKEVNKGLADSRNVGIKSATGDVIAILDADLEIISFPEDQILTILNDDNAIGLIGNYYTPGDGKASALDLRREVYFGKSDELFFFNLSENYTTFSGGISMFKKDTNNIFFANKKGKSGEDIIWSIKMLRENPGKSFVYLPQYLAKHHHYRNENALIMKLISEVKGDLWIFQQIVKLNINLPRVKEIFEFSLLSIISFFSFNPVLIFVAITIDIFKFILPIVLNKTTRNYSTKTQLTLVLYSYLSSIIKTLGVVKVLCAARTVSEVKLILRSAVKNSLIINVKSYSIIPGYGTRT